MAQRNNYVGGSTAGTQRGGGGPGTPKTAEDQYADQVYKRIIEVSGGQHQLVNDPQLHIIIAVLNIDVNDLIDRKLDYFKQEGEIPEDVAKVRYDHHKARRRTKLLQIENALKGSPENVFLSMGLNIGNVSAISQFSNYQKKKDFNDQHKMQDKSVDKLMETLACRSQFVSPQLQQHMPSSTQRYSRANHGTFSGSTLDRIHHQPAKSGRSNHGLRGSLPELGGKINKKPESVITNRNLKTAGTSQFGGGNDNGNKSVMGQSKMTNNRFWVDSSTLDYGGGDELAILMAREKERHSKFLEI